MDTFEYKPALQKYAGEQMPKAERTGELATFSAAPNRVIPPLLGLQAARAIGPLDVEPAAEPGHARRRYGVHPRPESRQQQSRARGLSHADRATCFPAARPSGPGSLTVWAPRTRTCRVSSYGRPARRNHRRRGRVGQWISSGGVPGHAVSERRNADRGPEPAAGMTGAAALRTRSAPAG